MKTKFLLVGMMMMFAFFTTVEAQTMSLASPSAGMKAMSKSAQSARQEVKEIQRAIPRMRANNAKKQKIQRLALQAEGLLKKIAQTQGRMSERQYKTFQRQLDDMNQQLAAPGIVDEGIGGCMRECADNFPGSGGGNGVNRIVCKFACLVHG